MTITEARKQIKKDTERGLEISKEGTFCGTELNPSVHPVEFYNDESAKTKKLVKELMKANGLEKEFDLFLKGHCTISSYFAKILDIATGNENFYQNVAINYLNYRSTILEQLLAKRK